MATYLITGFTGQVGSYFADFLLEKTNHDVVGMMRWQETLDNVSHLSPRINSGDRIRVEYADLGDYPSILRLLTNARPDVISHLAAQSFPRTSFDSPLETLQTNIVGTAGLLEAVRYLKDTDGYNPVVHVCSSSEVYGRQKQRHPLHEQSPFHAASPYSLSKIGADYLGQFYGEAYGIRTFVTRMGTHSGPRRSDVFFESTVAKQIALIEAGLQKPILKLGNLDSVRTFQDVRDAVRAYYLLAQASAEGHVKPGEVFNIAGNEAFTLHEVVSIFIGMSVVEGIEVMQDRARLRPIDADYQMFDNSKVKSVIDWEPEVPVRTMLQDLLNYWRARVRDGKIPLDR